MNKSLLRSTRHELEHAQRVLVVSHIRPDGDAVGSVAALGLSLREAGKQAQMVLADGVPRSFRMLPGTDQIQRRPKGEFDLAIVVDCSDMARTGAALVDYGPPDINIDHHPTNMNFGRINLVDAAAVSTTEILFAILGELGLPLTAEVGKLLLFGLLTDTIGFRTANVTPKALRAAADLMEMGIDMSALYFQALVARSYRAAQYWGKGLSRIQREGRMVWTSLTLSDRKDINYPGRDDADLVNMLSSIRDSDVAVIFVEQNPDRVKISWRARPGFDTAQIALQFGGGGHTAASGAEVEGTLEEVQERVLHATRTLFS